MATEQSIIYSLFTVKFRASAGDVVGIAIEPSTARKGIAAAVLNMHGTPIAVFGGAASAHGSIYTPVGGTYTIVFGNTAAPGITTDFGVMLADYGDGVMLITFSEGPIKHYAGQETAIVYCNARGNLNVWLASHAPGYFPFTATKDELVSVSPRPAQDTLIKSDVGVALYRLPTGKVQINAANDYVFVWNDSLTA